MNDQLSLFARYPEVPGAKGTDTSRMAADAIAPAAPNLRERVLAVFRLAGAAGLAADEAAGRLGLNVLAIRPRVSELVKMGELVRVHGERRRNESGQSAAVWQMKEQDEGARRDGAAWPTPTEEKDRY
jgi:hypothetical protein